MFGALPNFSVVTWFENYLVYVLWLSSRLQNKTFDLNYFVNYLLINLFHKKSDTVCLIFILTIFNSRLWTTLIRIPRLSNCFFLAFNVSLQSVLKFILQVIPIVWVSLNPFTVKMLQFCKSLTRKIKMLSPNLVCLKTTVEDQSILQYLE